MKYLLILVILLNDGNFQIMQNKHAPFDTKEACEEYGRFIEPQTQEMLAKLIDQGTEVTDHGVACRPVPVNEP